MKINKSIFYDDFTRNIISILKNKPSTIKEIKNILNKNGYIYTEQDIYNRLQLILTSSGRAPSPAQPEIIRKIIIGGEDIYEYLDYEIGKRAKYYREVKVNNNPKAILQVSDFHLGKWKSDKDITNNKIILANINNYTLSKGINIALVNGDVFDRIKLPKLSPSLDFIGENNLIINRAYEYLDNPSNRKEVISKLEYLKELFKYSIPNKDINYYSIIGNHDKTINALLISLYGIDLRYLSSINNNFYMFPHKKCSLNIGNRNILLSHEFYLSGLIDKNTNSGLFGKINHVEDLGQKSIRGVLNGGEYDIISCGHMHDAQLSTYKSKYSNKNPLYLITPATNINNINDAVGYITYFNYDNDTLISIDIEPLICKDNLEIVPGSIIHHSFIDKKEEYSLIVSNKYPTNTIYVNNQEYKFSKHIYMDEDNRLQYKISKDDNGYTLDIIYMYDDKERDINRVNIPNIDVKLSNIRIVFNDIIMFNNLDTDFIYFANNYFNEHLEYIREYISNNILKVYLEKEGNINIDIIPINNKVELNYKELFLLIEEYYNSMYEDYCKNIPKKLCKGAVAKLNN